MINIIIGLYIEQVQGNIYINNTDVKNINMKNRRKNKIALVEQDPYLYEDTVLNNIILDEPTNALDVQTKELLKEYIGHIKKDKIIIIITHDDYMSKYGDKIINLNEI